MWTTSWWHTLFSRYVRSERSEERGQDMARRTGKAAIRTQEKALRDKTDERLEDPSDVDERAV